MNKPWFDVQVSKVTRLTSRVNEYELSVSEAIKPPAWTAGAHVPLELHLDAQTQLIRHYSLIPGLKRNSDPSHTYTIAVQREASGRASNFIHDKFVAGTRLKMGVPINSFSLDRNAHEVLLLGAGIGITPLISMAKSLLLRRKSFQLIYCARTREEMAYAQELTELFGESLHLHESSSLGRIHLQKLFARQSLQTQVYVCGPRGFVHDAEKALVELDGSTKRLHQEVFVSATLPGDSAFKVSLRRSQIHLNVKASESLLEALTPLPIDLYWSCRKGECGLCASSVISFEGELVHRDQYLTDEEKQNGQNICLCVSRLKGRELVLDL